jgi:poly-gamma-glutamate synthase PgsB/CapB
VFPILFLLGLLLFFLALAVAEFVTHRRNVARIPIRIHVNGTRGKSSVTRLLVWALNEAGIRTFGKTTGTLPRAILPDGHEYPIYRPGGHANVIEQVRIFSFARREQCQALVLECMAVQPRLQWLSEHRLVSATHAVVTNAREDHLDVMGPTERDVALALAGMTPPGKSLFTCEVRNLDVFRKACEELNATLVPVSPEDVAKITREDMAGFSYHEHEDNVALALSVCASLGIDRQTALAGMWKAQPDAGALKSFEVDFFGRRVVLVNAFAANDPESTEKLWRMSLNLYPDVEKRIAVFNCRADRQHRSQQLAEAYVRWPQADSVVLMGSGTYIFAREAQKKGADPSRFMPLEGAGADTVFETLVGLSGRSSLVVGMANIAGPGLALVHYFENRSRLVQLVG